MYIKVKAVRSFFCSSNWLLVSCWLSSGMECWKGWWDGGEQQMSDSVWGKKMKYVFMDTMQLAERAAKICKFFNRLLQNLKITCTLPNLLVGIELWSTLIYTEYRFYVILILHLTFCFCNRPSKNPIKMPKIILCNS